MRDFVVPDSKPKLRLLDAAEQLVATKGFDAVSVRDVTLAAKANVASVNYHFGSREGMMSLVMMRRLMPIQQERLDRLSVVEKKWGSKGAPIEELLDAYLRPLVLLSGKWGLSESLSHRLVAKILALPAAALPEPLENTMHELWTRYMKALSKAMPSVARDEIAWRLHFITGGVIQLLAGSESLERWAQMGEDAVTASDHGLSRFLRFSVAAIREGVAEEEKASKPKGPQATFDF